MRGEIQGALNDLSPEFYGVTLKTDELINNAFRGNTRRPMDSTRYFENDMLKNLRLFEETESLFNNIGWGAILENAWQTYRGVTLEMLTTLKVGYIGRYVSNTINFQANNDEHRLNMTTINGAFDAPNNDIYLKHGDFSDAVFWPFLAAPQLTAF